MCDRSFDMVSSSQPSPLTENAMPTDAIRTARPTKTPIYANATHSSRAASLFVAVFASTALLGGLLGLFDAQASRASKSTQWAGQSVPMQVAVAPAF